jgi:hypothetical protein
MPFDSTADLLFRIGADSGDAEANIARFRALLGKDLGELSAEFSAWSTKVFGDLSTVQGAMTALTAGAAAGLVALGAAAIECASKYREYVGEVERGSRLTGISTENMSGLHLMAEETGVSYDSLTHGLSRFAAAIVKANEGGGAQMKMFTALGISQDQVKAGQKDMLPLLELVMDRFHKMGPAVGSSAAARALFSRNAGDLLRLLGMGGEALQHYIEKTKEMGRVVHATDVEAVETFNATMRITKSELSALADEIGRVVVPEFNNLIVGAMAAGIAIKNLPHLAAGLGSFVANLTLDIQALGKEVTTLANSMANMPKDAPGLDLGEGKAPKLKADYDAVSNVLTEIMSKMAELAGPEAKAADEAARLRDRLEEAKQKLEETYKAGEVSKAVYDAQMQNFRVAAVFLPELAAGMAKKAGDAVLAAVTETGNQLRAELLKQGPQTLAIKQAEFTAEMEARRAKIIEQGKRDNTDETANLELLDEVEVAGHKKIADDALREMLKADADLAARVAAQTEETFGARRAALNRHIADEMAAYVKEGHTIEQAETRFAAERKAGLDKIAADEKAAFDSEYARLQEQLARINRAHETSAERIAAEYTADAAKYSAAEERKTLALATNVWQRIAIMGQFAAIQAALAKKEQEDLQALKNSQGWQGVFGREFADGIKGNEALAKEWAAGQDRSQMLVQVALESTKEAAQDAFGHMASAMGGAISQALVYDKSIGKAMESALKSTLASLSSQAAAQAIMALAWGFYDLAMYPPNPEAASAAFTAAELFGAVAAVTGMLGRAVPGGGGAGSGGAGSARSGASGGGAGGGGGDYTENGRSGTAAGTGGPHLTVNFYGHVLGTSGASEVCDMLSGAVQNSGATLTATNTTTGVQVQK